MQLVVFIKLDISNPARPFINGQKWSGLIHEEFRLQEQLERETNLPLSNNNSTDQVTMQLAFTDIIVRPYFDALNDLFPRILNMVDIIQDNSKEWEKLLPPSANTTSNTSGRRRTDDDVKVKKPPKTTSNSFSDTVSLHRMSLAPGTIEIPEEVEKFINAVSKSGRMGMGTGRRVSIARPIARAARNLKPSMNDFAEEEES